MEENIRKNLIVPFKLRWLYVYPVETFQIKKVENWLSVDINYQCGFINEWINLQSVRDT